MNDAQPASQPAMVFTCRHYGITVLADRADKLCLDQLELMKYEHWRDRRTHCLDCERGTRLEEEMKKKRICKCGSGKELEKGKQKCEECKPGATKKKGENQPPAAEAPSASRAGNIITLDLGKRPEIAMRIHQLAQDNFRTVELQVLYMLTTMENK